MATVSELRIVQPHVRIGDPHVCSDDRHRLGLLRAIYEPLVRRAPGGGHAPALATSWEVTPDARVWTFRLREDASFHDGRSLSAEDVAASLRRIRDDPPAGELGTSGVYQSYLTGSAIEAERSDVVTLRLPGAMADLLDILVELVVLPANALSRSHDLPPGSGPYRLVERDGDEVLLERHAPSWGNAPGPDRIRWRALTSADARLDALLSDHADLASQVPAARIPVGSRGRTTLAWLPSSTTTTFMFNLREGPGTDPRLRRALNHAVDVEALIREVMRGQADRVGSPCTPPQLGYDPQLAPYPHDPERARALLAETGLSEPTLTFDIPERLPDEAPALAEAIAAQLARIGVGVETRVHRDRPGYAERVREGRIGDAACFDSSPVSTFRLFREKFHSGVRGVWWLGYQNDAFDALVDRASRETDLAARRAEYRRAARLLHHDAPWLYLYTPRLCWGIGPAAGGWRPTEDGLIDLSPRNAVG